MRTGFTIIIFIQWLGLSILPLAGYELVEVSLSTVHAYIGLTITLAILLTQHNNHER